MNSKLTKLYKSKWDSLQFEFDRINSDNELQTKPTNPLLLYINEVEYSSADFKVIIFGQETNGWYENDDSIEGIIKCYNQFYNGGECYSYGGQFWNGYNRFLKLLQEKYPSKKIGAVWNNIVKIGCSDRKGFPPDYIYETERQYFTVIKEEIEILKPNAIIFLTGPNYDSIIEDNFGKLKYEAILPYSQRWLSKVELKNIDFVFRTYHPNFLWRNDIDSFFNAIIKEIKIK